MRSKTDNSTRNDEYNATKFKSLDFEDSIDSKKTNENNNHNNNLEVSNNVSININNEIDTFDPLLLKKLSFFNSLLSNRWKNENSLQYDDNNNKNIDLTINPINDLIFGLNELKQLLFIIKLKW